MKLKNAILALGACSLLGVPAVAQAGTTASASVGKVTMLSGAAARQSVVVTKKKKDEGAGLNIGFGIAAAAAAGAGLYFGLHDGDNSTAGS